MKDPTPKTSVKKPTVRETCEAIKTGEFKHWPKEVQKKALLGKNSTGWTALHYAAAQGLLFEVPKDLMNEKVLLALNGEDWTPLDTACANNHFKQFPPEVLTEKALLTGDPQGHTALHSLTIYGRLDQIPKKLLTEKNLLTPDKEGNTPLLYVAVKGGLAELEKKVRLSSKSLKNLLDIPEISPGSREWIKKELGTREIRRALKTCSHPSL
jgi:ankyrin repeat protein